MDAVYLTLFVSTILAVLGLILFFFSHGQRTSDHADRLALLPLDDAPAAPIAAPNANPGADPR